jgi:hypothetical protein
MKKFVIKEGRHYCEWFWTKIFHPHYNHKIWDGVFSLSKECWWSPPRNDDDHDINKIIGVSFGLWHHRNSWRIGFVPVFTQINKFKIYGYFYDSTNKHHNEKFIGLIDADVLYRYDVYEVALLNNGSIANSKYIINIHEIGHCDYFNHVKDSELQFTLYPYMGGNNPAIRKMSIYATIRYL